MIVAALHYAKLRGLSFEDIRDIAELRFQNCPTMRAQYNRHRITPEGIATDLINFMKSRVDAPHNSKYLSRKGCAIWAGFINDVLLR